MDSLLRSRVGSVRLLSSFAFALSACGGPDGDVRFFTKDLVDMTHSYAGVQGSANALTMTGGYMPYEVGSLFRVLQNPDDISMGTVSQWAENPEACQSGNVATIDGTIYGDSCALDSTIFRASDGVGACASSDGVDVVPVQLLPFLSQWGVYPDTIAVKLLNHGNGYTAANVDAESKTNFAIYQGADGDFTQVMFGYRQTDTNDFSLVRFRTGDSGSPNLSFSVVLGNIATGEFETYGANEDSTVGFSVRVLSKAGYAFVQRWESNSPSGTPDGDLFRNGDPGPRCFSTDTYQEVDMAECETAMGGTAMATGTQDDLFKLKLVDWQTTVALTADYFKPENHTVFKGNTVPSAEGCL